MDKYKIGVSKGQKKYNFIFEAKNIEEAKNRVHKDGYSILTIEKIKNEYTLGKKFYFIATLKNKEKKGQVIGKDIFKVYLKLIELGYNISELYEEGDKNLSFLEKNKIIKNLEDQYTLFNTGKKTEEIVVKDNDLGEDNLKNFYLKKDLDNKYRLINLVLKKLGNILEKKIDYNLEEKKERKLQDIYNNLIKLKKITNISKLKTIGELALIKIGEIELEKLDKTKDIKTKVLLKETNKLLKQAGSSKQFIEKEKDLKLILKNFFKKLTNKKVKKVIQKESLDKNSYSYMKNLLLLSKYKNTLRINKLGIIKYFKLFVFNKKELNLKKLKIKVIKQNIAILSARQKGKIISYTKIMKSTISLLDSINILFDNLNKYIYSIIILYIIYFIASLNLVGKNINYEGMYLFLLLFILYFLISLSRNVFLLILNFVFFYFIIIFGNINF